MRVRVVNPSNIDDEAIAEAAAIICGGGLVAFPTETVYGLGADATNADAVKKIFAAKGRPSYNPLIVHVPDVGSAHAVVSEWPDTAGILATAFWPGPLTLVLPRDLSMPDEVTAGLSTVGVRVPSHPVALALLRAAGRPIAAPSANPSMRVSPTDGRHVATAFVAQPDLLLDAGMVTVGIESTVLDLTQSVPTILRPGMISRGDLARVIGDVRVAGTHPAGDDARPSPGMMDRHYSPRARLILGATHGLDEVVAREAARGRTAAIVRSSSTVAGASVTRLPDSPADFARLLYATLHRLDGEGFDVIVVEAVPDGDAWDGVRDRLARAATASS